MKTKEELDALKEEIETLNKKLAELTEEELKQVSGGAEPGTQIPAQGTGNAQASLKVVDCALQKCLDQEA